MARAVHSPSSDGGFDASPGVLGRKTRISRISDDEDYKTEDEKDAEGDEDDLLPESPKTTNTIPNGRPRRKSSQSQHEEVATTRTTRSSKQAHSATPSPRRTTIKLKTAKSSDKLPRDTSSYDLRTSSAAPTDEFQTTRSGRVVRTRIIYNEEDDDDDESDRNQSGRYKSGSRKQKGRRQSAPARTSSKKNRSRKTKQEYSSDVYTEGDEDDDEDDDMVDEEEEFSESEVVHMHGEDAEYQPSGLSGVYKKKKKDPTKTMELRARDGKSYALPTQDEIDKMDLQMNESPIKRSSKRGLERSLPNLDTLAYLGNLYNRDGDDSSDEDGANRAARAHQHPGGSGLLAGGGGGGAYQIGGNVTNLGKLPQSTNLADTDPLLSSAKVSFDAVGGLDSHIQQLKEMVSLPLLYPEIFQRFQITPPRGVLFHGPPGTGKTLLARALANSCSTSTQKISFFMRKGADALSKWVGEAERQLRLLFEEAKNSQPSIIFFDEIDGLAPVRSSKQEQIHSSIVSTLLALMDGMDGRGQVVVIGATNRPDAIDPALRRPGRFDREFYFPLPNSEARRKILDIHTSGWEPPLDNDFKDEIADLTKGYGGADLRALCTEAALSAVQRQYPQIYKTADRLVIQPENIKVTARDFMLSSKNLIPSTFRSTSSPASPLPEYLKPILQSTLNNAINAMSRILPEIKKVRVLEEAEYEPDPNSTFKKEKYMQSLETMRIHRPRLIIHGGEGMGQHYVGSAILHHLDGHHIQPFDIATLFNDSSRTPEATCVQLFTEAKRHKPSILFIQSLKSWTSLSESVLTTFTSLLESLPPTEPVMLLALSDCLWSELPTEVRTWFGISPDSRVSISKPKPAERKLFFQEIYDGCARSPKDYPDGVKRKKRILEELPKAAPLPPRELTEAELAAQIQSDSHVMDLLKNRLMNVVKELRKRYRRFCKPVGVPGETVAFPQRVGVVAADISPISEKGPEMLTENATEENTTLPVPTTDADVVMAETTEENMENAVHVESAAIATNIENSVNAETAENVENAENAENVENTEIVNNAKESEATEEQEPTPVVTNDVATPSVEAQHATVVAPIAPAPTELAEKTNEATDATTIISEAQVTHIFVDIDLDKMHNKAFLEQYLTPVDFLRDVGEILKNAEFSGDSDMSMKAKDLHTQAKILVDQQFDPMLIADFYRMAARHREMRKRQKRKERENGNNTANGVPAIGITDVNDTCGSNLKRRLDEHTEDNDADGNPSKRNRLDHNGNVNGNEKADNADQVENVPLGENPHLDSNLAQNANESLLVPNNKSIPNGHSLNRLLNVDHQQTNGVASEMSTPLSDIISRASTPSAVNPPDYATPKSSKTEEASTTNTNVVEEEEEEENLENLYSFDSSKADKLLDYLIKSTDGYNLEFLEQIRAACVDEIWRAKSEWDRNSVIRKLEILSKAIITEAKNLK